MELRSIVIAVLLILLLYAITHTRSSAPRQQGGGAAADGIPRVIYGYWHTKDYPPGMKDAIEEVKRRNPDFEYRIYNEAEALDFLESKYPPDVVRAFKCLKPSAYKSDLWRYCVLYTNGGVYMDVKFIPEIPLTECLKDAPVYVKDLPRHCNGTALANGFLVSAAGNPVLKACIDEIVVNCKTKSYRNGFLDVTGPCLLGRVVRRFESAEKVFSNPYRLAFPNGSGEIFKGDVSILREYPTYREEQKKVQKEGKYYKQMYDERDIYGEF